MNRLGILLVIVGIGCGKSAEDKRSAGSAEAKPVKPATDPACAAKLDGFATWMAALDEEKAAYEIEMSGHLATIDRAPAPVDQELDAIVLTPNRLEGYDASESNHVGGDLGKTDADILAKLTKMHALTNKNADRIRVDIDEATPWAQAVRVVDAIQKAGYTHALFAFAATSKVVPPAGVEPWTMTEEAHDAATAKLAALKKGCKDWNDGIITSAKELAAALASCNCAADPDDVRVQTFKATRWHQAHPHVGVLVQLGDGGTAIAAPASATWAEGAKQLVAGPTAVKLAVK